MRKYCEILTNRPGFVFLKRVMVSGTNVFILSIVVYLYQIMCACAQMDRIFEFRAHNLTFLYHSVYTQCNNCYVKKLSVHDVSYSYYPYKQIENIEIFVVVPQHRDFMRVSVIFLKSSRI